MKRKRVKKDGKARLERSVRKFGGYDGSKAAKLRLYCSRERTEGGQQ